MRLLRAMLTVDRLAWRLARTPAGVVALAVALAMAMRAPFLHKMAFPDEAGYLLVARNWHEGGTNLYGSIFIDRPPMLLLFYQVANVLGGLEAARLLGLVAAATVVAAAGWAGHSIGGPRGTAWGALVAAALIANPALGTWEINAELVGAPLTMVACAMLLAGTQGGRRPGTRHVLVFAAGAFGAAALLVKQNLLDAIVFGIALALAAGLSAAWPWSRVRGVLMLGVLGALVPWGLTMLWAATEGPGLSSLWYTLFKFRFVAAGVVSGTPSPANDARMIALASVAVTSGLVLLVAVAGATLWRPLRRRDPVVIASFAMVAWEIVGILGGGSFWLHYLVGLIPGAVLLTAAVAARPSRGALAGRAGVATLVFVMASAVVSAGLGASTAAPESHVGRESLAVGRWLHAAHAPGDSGVVFYGNAQLLLTGGLRPGSQQLWSLPARTLDPQMRQLNADLNGPTPPTWLILVMPLDTWGMDPEHLVLATMSLSYRQVGEVCGARLYLHRGVHRSLPTAPSHC